jgi:glycosyltransferase involved in cell wall biosynthesis
MDLRSNSPRVSVVVNTYNRAGSLHQLLQAMVRQNHSNFEVIVVNGPSTDDTLHVLRAHADEIRVGSCAQRNLSISRNVGIEMARGEFVAFIDDDAIPDEDWLVDAIAAFDSNEIAGVGGFVFDHTGYELQYSYTVCDRMGNAYHNLAIPMPDFCYPGCHRFPALLGTNSIFRRSALLEIGGFDEQFDYFLDETDVNVRLIDAGYVLRQVSRAFVYHRYLPSHIRNEQRVNTNYAPMIRNRIYFSLKNASLVDGQSAERLRDWAILCRDALYSVNWNISKGKLQRDVLERLQVEMDASVEEGIQLGMNRPRRLLDSTFAKRMRGEVAYDLDLSTEHGAAPPGEFKRCPIVLPKSEKLTIALLSQQYPPGVVGGIGRLTRDLAQGLVAVGHNIHVLARAAPGSIANTVDFEDGVWVHRLIEDGDEGSAPNEMKVPPHLWRHSARMLRELDRLNEMHPIDIVEAPIWDAEGLAAILRDKFCVVTSLHTPLKKVIETNPDWRVNMTAAKGETYEEIAQAESFVATRADGLRANSHAVLETMRRLYDLHFEGNRVAILPHGMEDRTRGAGNSEGGASSGDRNVVTVLYAGRFEGRKGTDVLLAAIPELCEKYPFARFVLVGEDRTLPDGSTLGGDFRTRHARANFLDRVIFAGEVSDAQLEQHLRQCDIFAAPSRYESFGLVFLEAMMFGKPVVGCRAGGMSEVIDERVTGLLAEPGDVPSLVSTVGALLEDGAKRNEFGKAGRERYVRLYTREALIDRTLTFYRETLSRRSERSRAERRSRFERQHLKSLIPTSLVQR